MKPPETATIASASAANDAAPAANDDTPRDVFLETAFSLGARVCRDALWAEERCNWIGPSMEPLGGRWRQVHKAYQADLYGGTSGIAWALARLHAATGERVFRRTALGAIRHALARAEDLEPVARIGVYSGWVGIAQAALEVAATLGEDEPREPALALLEPVIAGELELEQLDLLAGCGGAIPALISIRQDHDGPESLLAAAVALGDHLLAVGSRDDAGLSWGDFGQPGSTLRGNLAGFAHGAAGIAWALLELFHATGEARFRDAAEDGFRYERHHFDPERRNWPDLRDPTVSGMPIENPDEPQFMRAWCHGAPGIGLTRLRAWQLLGDQVYRDEAELAVETTLETLEPGPEMSQTNFSLCHGRGGNCDLLIYAAQVLGRPELHQHAADAGLAAIQSYELQKMPWPCGTQGSVEVPGLMLGLTGIAHFFLRLVDPETFSPLTILLPRDVES